MKGGERKGAGTVLAFTSDTHNTSGNASANRLGSWLDNLQSTYGKKVDVMSFGGDMAGAGASGYWDLTQADMNKLNDRSITGVYTTGNHEISYGGDFSYNAYTSGSYSSAETRGQFRLDQEVAAGDYYRIYCLGSRSSSSDYSSQVSALTSYLDRVGNDQAIFIITHFPLHYYSYRTTTGASSIIDALNNAVTKNGQTIVFLWGHNHTMSDTYYDQIYGPGKVNEIQYGSSSSEKKTIKFYYGAAGCMSDSDYGSGSGYVKGKGLAVLITPTNDTATLEFAYRNASGTDVTEPNSVRAAVIGSDYIPEDPPVVNPPVVGNTVSITPTTDNPSESIQIGVGETLVINVTNGSSSSA